MWVNRYPTDNLKRRESIESLSTDNCLNCPSNSRRQRNCLQTRVEWETYEKNEQKKQTICSSHISLTTWLSAHHSSIQTESNILWHPKWFCLRNGTGAIVSQKSHFDNNNKKKINKTHLKKNSSYCCIFFHPNISKYVQYTK